MRIKVARVCNGCENAAGNGKLKVIRNIEEIKRMDKLRDIWSHRRLVSLFAELIQSPNSCNGWTVVLRPVCPMCGKKWKEKSWSYANPYKRTETKIQAWISSIMARHFRNEHEFNLSKIPYSGSSDIPSVYQCKCGALIIGLLQAISHWMNCRKLKEVN